MISPATSEPRIGLAHSGYVRTFLQEHPDAIDYVEMPYELLQHEPRVQAIAELKPLVLHCASLSVAGTVPPSDETVRAIQHWIEATQTPWLGEHLAFVTADRIEAGPFADAYAAGEPYNIGYTVNPVTNAETVDLVLRKLELYSKTFPVPVLLENAPVYFRAPGSTMSQTEFICELCKHSDLLLLLDLAHHFITCKTIGVDPFDELLSLPLDRVTEVHISGVDCQEGMHWDDHTMRAPSEIDRLLQMTLARAPVRAVTLEYNWSMRFSQGILLEEIAKTREILRFRPHI
ncbi:MAG: DUF692 family protein [Isosphaeraceae bacterium]|nr:DUF692 family protein [Isosphaeraceae bacterium]